MPIDFNKLREEMEEEESICQTAVDTYEKDTTPEKFCNFFHVHEYTSAHKNKCREILEGVTLRDGTKLPRPTFIAQLHGCGGGAYINVYETKKRKTTLFTFTCERLKRTGGRTFYSSFEYQYNMKMDAKDFIQTEGATAYYTLLYLNKSMNSDYYTNPKEALAKFEQEAKWFQDTTSISIFDITPAVVEYCQSVISGTSK